MSFWTEIVTEAVAGRIDQARSGRREIHNQREQDLLLKVLPTLSEGLAMEGQVALKVACYAIIMILASKLSLSQKVTQSLMEATATSMSQETRNAAVLCLSALLAGAPSNELPKIVAERLRGMDGLEAVLTRLNATYTIGQLVLALVEATLQKSVTKEIPSRLNFVIRMLNLDTMDDAQLESAAVVISKFIKQSGEGGDVLSSLSPAISVQIRSLLQHVHLSHDMQVSAVDSKDISAEDESASDVEMGDAPDSKIKDTWTSAISHIPSRTVDETTFMGPERTVLFQQLANAFQTAVSSPDILKEFNALPVLRGESRMKDALFFSFFVRVAISDVMPQARAAAWQVIGASISDLPKPLDAQIILPYALVGLSDPSRKVRAQVVTALSAMASALPGTSPNQDIPHISPLEFYGKTQPAQLPQLSVAEVTKIYERVLIPYLEEYMSDPGQILRSIAIALTGTTAHTHLILSTVAIELKKNLRTAFFDFLLSHTSQTPLYSVKCCLLNAIKHVDKVGSIRKSTKLLPTLQQWCDMDADAVKQASENENFTIGEIDLTMFTIVSHSDEDAVSSILSCVDHVGLDTRPSLLNAASQRIHGLWPRLNAERQLTATNSLLDMALSPSAAKLPLCRSSRELLWSLELSATVLSHCIDNTLTTGVTSSDQPPSKKRRTSQNQMVLFNAASPDLSQLIRRISLVLELVDSSTVEGTPELTVSLFHVLTWLQTLKTTLHSELGYLLSLTLGSLLAIVKHVSSSQRQDIDLSSTRIDLVVDCARVTDNPQVQNTALLLVAALASIAPEHVLHSVMPIFTFMGSSLLKKDDDYSAHVVNQAIDRIVPPLISSLQRQKKDIVSGTSDLLSSFVAAFEHMPTSRRLDLFDILIQRVGPVDSLYAVLAMLAIRYPENPDVESFSVLLSSRFSVETQLQTYKGYLDLVMDTLKPKPLYSQMLLGTSHDENDDAFAAARNLCGALSRLLVKSELKRSMSKALRKDETKALLIRKDFSDLLEQMLSFTQNVASHPDLSTAANETLASLLDLLSLSELVIVVERLISRPGDRIRTRAIRLLETRLRTSAGKDSSTHSIILGLLSRMAEIIRESAESRLKHAAIACIDQICDKLGRKDPSAVAMIAAAICGSGCLTSTDTQLSTMALLCLSSMVEVLKDSVIPVLPSMMSRLFDLLAVSVADDEEDSQLHNASFALLGALLTHVPFMLSEYHIDSILRAASESANSILDPDCDEARKDVLQLLARNIDVKRTIAAVDRNWIAAVANGVEAVTQALSVLEVMIDSTPKSAVSSNNEILHGILLKAFDLRRMQLKRVTEDSYSEEEISQIESKSNDVTIKMIYKLNDAVFRPLFSRTVEWATKAQDLPNLSPSDTELRQITLFKFLALFFDTLESIVTSYVSLIIPSATSFLNTYNPSNASTSPNTFTLYTTILSTLTAAFTHDADDFFAIPSTFTALLTPLFAQLTHLTTPSVLRTHLTPHLLPTFVAFATSLTSSPPHLKTLNQRLCAMRSSDSASVRLASVRVQAALTKELGEDWLANSGEMMVYIQRMLEDEDEKVEEETRRWVAEVQEVLGEDVGEMLQT